MKRDHKVEAMFPFMKELGDLLDEYERIAGRPIKVESFYEQDVTCPLCGERELRATRDATAPAAVMAVCSKCTEV